MKIMNQDENEPEIEIDDVTALLLTFAWEVWSDCVDEHTHSFNASAARELAEKYRAELTGLTQEETQ